MDTPTHALINRLTARRFWPDAASNRSVNWLTLMGALPDVDTFFGGDDLTYIQAHRGVTHSFAGIAVIGLAAAWLAGRLGVPGTFLRRYAISVCGMLLHVLFDVVTSYGTQILYPFSDWRAAVDVLFIIDPYLTGLVVIFLILGWRTHSRLYWHGHNALIAYFGIQIALFGYGLQQVGDWANANKVSIDQGVVMPMPFSPLHRRGMVQSGGETIWLTVPTFGRTGETVYRYQTATSLPELEAVWDSEPGKTYRWFSRYPVISKREGDVLFVEDLTYKVKTSGLGWLGDAALEAMLSSNPEFLDRKIFYLEVDLKTGEVVFRR